MPPVEYSTIDAIRGPLLVVRGVTGVGWDEFVRIRLDAGPPRHGVVLDVDHDIAIVEVLEGTDGMDRLGTHVAFNGSPFRIPVGDGWLGRVCNGRGEPIDDGPPYWRHTTRRSREIHSTRRYASRPPSRSSPESRRSTASPPSYAGRSYRSSL
ncbi:hypothetical protein ACFQ1L_33245 [Phytohabitans flavus]|uniref:hypothetical protein n=1 Tax=Phytohabitans flavus TaxID=1076124 RepID=UPI0036409386